MGPIGGEDVLPWLVASSQNIAMGLALVFIYNFVRASAQIKHPRIQSAVVGVIFGCGAIASMMLPLFTGTGLIIDARTVFVLVGSIYGGPIGGLAAAIPASLYRIELGGPGAFPGTISIVVSAIFGSMVGLRYRGRAHEISGYLLLGTGLANTILITVTILAISALRHAPSLPPAPIYAGFVAFPIGTLLLGGAMSMTHHRILWRTRQRLADIVDSSTDMIWEVDQTERFAYIAGQLRSVLGIAPEELLGQSIESLGMQWIDDATRHLHREAVAARRPFTDLRVLFRSRDGAKKILSVGGRPTHDERRRFVGYRGMITDITERENWRGLTGAISNKVGSAIGQNFLKTLVQSVAEVLEADRVFIGRFDHGARTVLPQYIFMGKKFVDTPETSAYEGLPSGVVAGGKTVMINDGLAAHFPRSAEIIGDAQSYAGIPLLSSSGAVLGILSASSRGRWATPEYVEAALDLFAGRAAAELERALTEEERRRSHDLLAHAQRVGRMGSVEVDLATGAAVWSAETYHIFGLDPAIAEPNFEQFYALVHPDDRLRLRELRQQDNDGTISRPCEYRLIRPDGELRWIYRQSEVVNDASGKPARLIITHQDVTEREKYRRVMATLNSNVGNLIGQEFLLSLVANVAQALGADTVFLGSFEQGGAVLRTRYLYSGGRIRENRVISTVGAPSGEIARGNTVILQSGLEQKFPHTAKVVDEHMEGYAGTPLLSAKGEVLGLLVAISPRPWEEPEYVETVLGLFARRAAAEIDRLAIEAEAERSRNQMSEVLAGLNIAHDAIMLTDPDRKITYANQAAVDLFGLPANPQAVIGRRLHEFQSAPDFLARADKVVDAVLKEGMWRGMAQLTRASDGQTVWAEGRMHRLPTGGMILVATDATERLRHEEEERVRQARNAEAGKVEALGKLAGGVAHDFNNLLGAIIGFSQFLVEDLEPESESRLFAERIVSVGQRGRSLVQQILAFARRSEFEPRNVRLADTIAETHELLRATLPTTTVITIRNRLKTAEVLADQGQLVQVLVNLCVNGSDALAGEPGRITISVDQLNPAQPQLERLPFARSKPTPTSVAVWQEAEGDSWIGTGAVPADACVVLTVSDTGTGIPESLHPQIFEPFFTTKERGRGTGIGLAVVHRIVTDHGGAILVHTRNGKGTEFQIILPLIASIAVSADHGLPASPTRVSSARSASILVVDDDEAVCAMIETALMRLGHQVRSTGDPREVLKWLRASTNPWDVLITDQTMPHVKGSDLVRAVKLHLPTTKCIICTGYGSDLNKEQADAAGADAVMLKPFDVGELAGIVARFVEHKAGERLIT